MQIYIKINFNVNLHYLFVHTLVYNKHSLFNMQGMNKKVLYFFIPYVFI